MIGRRLDFFIASKTNSNYSNLDMSILFEEALKLPNDERRKLAYDIIETLDESQEEFYLTAEQDAELQRRIAEHEKQPDDAIPWEEVWERLRKR